MDDIYLKQMMTGKSSSMAQLKVKAEELPNDNNTDWENEIEAYAEELAQLAVKEMGTENNMLTPEAQKARLKDEFKQALLMKDIERSLEQAIQILNQEGPYFSDPKHWGYMTWEFMEAASQLQNEAKNPDSDPDQTLQEKAAISEGALHCVEEVAKKKYNEKDYESCKFLYTFLCILNNRRLEFWQRLGVSHQELNEFELAIKAYENVWMLQQDDIPTRLFAAECYIKLKNKLKAEELCESAQALIETQIEMQKWRAYLTALQGWIANLL